MKANNFKFVLILTTIFMTALATTAIAADSNKTGAGDSQQSASNSKDSSESKSRCRNEGRGNENRGSNERKILCPKLSSIVITPAVSTIDVGTTETLTVSTLDQFGNPITVEPEYRWSATGTGTLIATGNTAQYTAGSIAETAVVSVRLENLTAISTITVQIPVPIGPTSRSLEILIVLTLAYSIYRVRKKYKTIS